MDTNASRKMVVPSYMVGNPEIDKLLDDMEGMKDPYEKMNRSQRRQLIKDTRKRMTKSHKKNKR